MSGTGTVVSWIFTLADCGREDVCWGPAVVGRGDGGVRAEPGLPLPRDGAADLMGRKGGWGLVALICTL